MSKQNNNLDKILDYELRPWLPQNSLDDVFASKFRSLKEYTPKQSVHFQIDFHRPFDHKTKYYSRLILNTVKSDFDTLYQTINEDRNENLIRYYLNDTLNKRLKTRLKDLGELLKEKDYALVYINPKNTSHQLDQAHKANTYIMQLLKLAYMQLYLEIQEAFKDWVDDVLIVEDFYTQLLNEPIPEQLHIKKLQVLEFTPEPVRKPKPKATDKPIQFNSFTYKQYNTNPDKLGDLWDSLKLNKFISADTPLATFKKVFSGSEINIPITWTGNISELFYFVKRIHKDLQLIEDLKQKQWQVTCICFLDENGELFDRSKFRSLKRPNLTGDKIDSAVNLLK
ncbi:hypothetical protein Q4553_04655 [Tenacibaculum soleae]|uniref:DUF6617 family protein n=1 Tax=Tenacibaculum soleae TaxID=447689 RepID=UPI0026E11E27|nr:DUF6617 family protein [Tenacibaculum soleae]MDO6743854.1 hypothetical protein [Tenacibaculum soleae]